MNASCTHYLPIEKLYNNQMGLHHLNCMGDMRGPLEALRELWTREEAEEPTLDGLSQIRARLKEMNKKVEISMKNAQRK